MLKNIIYLFLFATLTGNAASNIDLKTNANINAICSISAEDAIFGNYYPNSTAIFQNGISQETLINVNVLCNNRKTYSIIGMPNISKNGRLGRFLTSSSPLNKDEILFNVYANNCENGARFGSGVVGGVTTVPINGTGTGQNKGHTLCFGIWPSNIYPGYLQTPDTYSSSYTLTITY